MTDFHICLESDIPIDDSTTDDIVSACSASVITEGIFLPLFVHVRLTDDEEIREINREYRKMDKSTDVLSFPSLPFHPGYTASQQSSLLLTMYDPDEDAYFLGDIIISIPHARAQAEEFGHGSQYFLNEHLTDGVDRIYGFHVTPEAELGQFILSDDIDAASCDYMKITLSGKGAHISKPHLANDALLAANAIVNNLTSLKNRTVMA